MIKLVQLTEAQYLVHCAEYNVYFVGPKNEAVEVLKTLDIEEDEVEWAVSLFKDKNHNVADFGLARLVTFTEKQDLVIQNVA